MSIVNGAQATAYYTASLVLSDVTCSTTSTSSTTSTTSSTTSSTLAPASAPAPAPAPASSAPSAPPPAGPPTTVTLPATYFEASGDCSTGQGLGNAIYCCDGACIDGTSIGKAGLCDNWLNLCLDLEGGAPTCSPQQVLTPGTDGNSINSGDGTCYSPGAADCQWQRHNWTWSCCNCPVGFISITGGACQAGTTGVAQGPPALPCVGCLVGVLGGDSSTGYYCTSS